MKVNACGLSLARLFRHRSVCINLTITLLVLVTLSALADAPDTQLEGDTSAPARGIAPGPLAANDCDRCHQIDSQQSHPVDVVPSMHVPGDLPLLNGRISCLTCHDPTSADDHGRLNGRVDPLLRGGSEGLEFCSKCHENASSSRNSPHANGLLRAHPQTAGLDLSETTAPDSGNGPGLDPESQSCLVCHDGSAAVDAASDLPGSGSMKISAMQIFDASRSHPVGVPYRTNRKSESRAELRTLASLDPRIRLFDGKVGCASCHSIYAPKLGGRLVMSNDRSTLCLGCHLY